VADISQEIKAHLQRESRERGYQLVFAEADSTEGEIFHIAAERYAAVALKNGEYVLRRSKSTEYAPAGELVHRGRWIREEHLLEFLKDRGDRLRAKEGGRQNSAGAPQE